MRVCEGGREGKQCGCVREGGRESVCEREMQGDRQREIGRERGTEIWTERENQTDGKYTQRQSDR